MLQICQNYASCHKVSTNYANVALKSKQIAKYGANLSITMQLMQKCGLIMAPLRQFYIDFDEFVRFSSHCLEKIPENPSPDRRETGRGKQMHRKIGALGAKFMTGSCARVKHSGATCSAGVSKVPIKISLRKEDTLEQGAAVEFFFYCGATISHEMGRVRAKQAGRQESTRAFHWEVYTRHRPPG